MSNQSMQVGLLFIPLIAFIALFVWGFRYFHNKQKAAWDIAAKSLGLHCENRFISGTLEGISLTATMELRGSRKTKTPYTVFVLDLKGHLPAGLVIIKETLWQTLGKLVGMDDVLLGRAGLDSKIVVKANVDEEVRKWAKDEEVASAMQDLAGLRGVFRLTESHLFFEFPGPISKANKLEEMIRRLVSVAARVSNTI